MWNKRIITAIKNDIAIYAIHTNLDNVHNGVSHRMAEQLDLRNCKILSPKSRLLKKLYTYVPPAYAETVRDALFSVGGGHIGNYSECSFSTTGTGTFKPGAGTQPFIGEVGTREETSEVKMEIVFPSQLQHRIVAALLQSHPYEEVAYDILSLANEFEKVGSGIIGELDQPVSEMEFLAILQQTFGVTVIKHTQLLIEMLKKLRCAAARAYSCCQKPWQKKRIFISLPM